MADVNIDELNLPEDVRAKIAELDLELSEGNTTLHVSTSYLMNELDE